MFSLREMWMLSGLITCLVDDGRWWFCVDLDVNNRIQFLGKCFQCQIFFSIADKRDVHQQQQPRRARQPPADRIASAKSPPASWVFFIMQCSPVFSFNLTFRFLLTSHTAPTSFDFRRESSSKQIIKFFCFAIWKFCWFHRTLKSIKLPKKRKIKFPLCPRNAVKRRGEKCCEESKVQTEFSPRFIRKFNR